MCTSDCLYVHLGVLQSKYLLCLFHERKTEYVLMLIYSEIPSIDSLLYSALK